jgi:hypothetical protein
MTSWDEVSRIASALPGAEPSTSWGRPCFKVDGRAFVTQRPLSKRDVKQLQEAHRRVPDSELVLVRVEHEVAKQAVLETETACLTIPHLDGYPAVLVELDEVTPELLSELVSESFLVCGGQLEAAQSGE